MEDDRVAILEAQLSQAKLIAEESDKKYEEVNACPTSKSNNILLYYVERSFFYMNHSKAI